VTPKIPHDNGIAIFRYRDGTIAEVVCSFTCVPVRTPRNRW